MGQILDFQRAITSGNEKLVADFIENGADVNRRFVRKQTPLHIAARQGHLKIAELLISKGAEVNLENDVWRTPLDLAIEYKHLALKILLEKHGGKKAVELSLHAAVYHGDSKRVRSYLAAGANVGEKRIGQLPVCIALDRKHFQIARCLLDQKPNVTGAQEGGNTALHFAVKSKAKQEVLETLLNLGADVNAEGYVSHTPLDLAARQNARATVEFLLAHGADINHQSEGKWSAVSSALWGGRQL